MSSSEYSSSNDFAERERIKRVKSEKKKEKRKLVESRDDVRRSSHNVANKALDTFLDERKHLKIVRDKANTSQFKIDADEEVWIFQCPKNIEAEDLLGRKLVLPQPLQIIHSKRGNKEFECKLELTKQENHLTMICPAKGFPEAVSVKQAGMISIRERVKLPQTNENGSIDPNATDKQFYYPTNLKIRHPLLGVNFDNVAIKEEKEDEAVRVTPKKKKSSGHNSSTDRIKIKQEPDEEISDFSLKKEKKRNKRPRESFEIKVEPDEEAQPSKKHKHKKARLDEYTTSSSKQKRASIKIEPDSS